MDGKTFIKKALDAQKEGKTIFLKKHGIEFLVDVTEPDDNRMRTVFFLGSLNWLDEPERQTWEHFSKKEAKWLLTRSRITQILDNPKKEG